MYGHTKRGFLAFFILAGLVITSSSAAFAQRRFTPAERYRNDTGQNALSVFKVLYPAWGVTAQSDVFSNCDIQTVGPYAVICCHEGVVLPGGRARVAFAGLSARVLTAEWHDNNSCSSYTGPATPVPFVKVNVNSPLSVTVEHGARQWDYDNDQPGDDWGTIYGRQVNYAVVDTWYPLDQLTEDLFIDESITWQPLSDFTLNNLGNQASYDLGSLTADDIVLFRFYTEVSPTPGDSDFELVQFQAGADIPTITEWGMVTMILLLLAAGTVILVRRRVRTA